MHLLQLFEAMKHDKHVLWDNGTYFIAGNDPTDPTFLTLWTEDNKRIGQLGTRLMRRNDEDWLGVAEVSVAKPYQGERLAFRMYQALLKNMPQRYAGLIGYQPDIVSNRVHKIYKRLGAHVEDGDYYIVYNPNRQTAITDDISDEMRHEFSCGSCAFLALLLHQEFGWPMAGYFDRDYEAEENQKLMGVDTPVYDDIHHVWVEIPGTGKAIDINGVADANELERDWSEQSGAHEGRGNYVYEIDPGWVEGFINQWNPTPQVRENIFDMARSAVQELKVELKQEGLIESRRRPQMVVPDVYHASGAHKEFAKLSTRDRMLFFSKTPRTSEFGKRVFAGTVWFNNPFLLGPHEIEQIIDEMPDGTALDIIAGLEGAGDEEMEEMLQGQSPEEYLLMMMGEDEGAWQHPEFVQGIKNAGYDGVISNDPFGGGQEYVIFNDKQFIPKKQYTVEGILNEDEEEHIVAHMKEFAKQHGILIELSAEAGMIPGITVTDLYADNPGSGGGTKVLNELIKLADQHEVMLFIWPEGERNKLFYERFGFSMTQMPPQMIRVPNFDPEEFEELRRSENLMEVEIGRTLYHGTTKERAKEIMQNGLEPKVGGLVKMAYEEYEDVVGELEPLGFAAEKEQFGAVMSAIKYHVENMLGERHMASAEDILKYGAVLVFRDGEGEFVHRSEDHDPTDYEEHPTQVEPGDWYSWDTIKPSYVLTGKPMLRLLKRMGSWPLVGAYGQDPTQDKAVRADVIRRLINKHKDKTRGEIMAWVDKLNPLELTQQRWQLQNVQEARKPREPRWDYWQFMDHFGIEEKARNLHDYVLPWVNETRPGNINKMVRDPEYRLIGQLALYFKLLRAGKPITRGGTKSTLSKFEAALDTPIQVWRGGGGDYDPNRKHPRPWISFTMDKRRVKTFSQYAGTYASPAFMLPERTRYWEIELTIPLRNIVGYIGVGGDAEVLVSAKDAKNAQLITGKEQIAGQVTESLQQVYDTLEVISQMQNWDEFFHEMRDAWVGGIADFGQPQAAINIRAHPQYETYHAALADAVEKYIGDPFAAYRLMAEDQIAEWESGADMPAVAVSLDKRVAQAFRKFADNRGREDLRLVQLSVPSSAVIMIGHEGEQELVVDPNWISANEVVVVENQGTVVEKGHIK